MESLAAIHARQERLLLARHATLARAIKLNWADRRIADTGARALRDVALRDKRRLHLLVKLDLTRNLLTDDGALALCDALEGGAMRHLVRLNLSQNRITSRGAAALARILGLGALPHLCDLRLERNRVDDAGLEALAAAIASETFRAPLRELHIGGNQNSYAGRRALEEVGEWAAVRVRPAVACYINYATPSGRDGVIAVPRSLCPCVDMLWDAIVAKLDQINIFMEGGEPTSAGDHGEGVAPLTRTNWSVGNLFHHWNRWSNRHRLRFHYHYDPSQVEL